MLRSSTLKWSNHSLYDPTSPRPQSPKPEGEEAVSNPMWGQGQTQTQTQGRLGGGSPRGGVSAGRARAGSDAGVGAGVGAGVSPRRRRDSVDEDIELMASVSISSFMKRVLHRKKRLSGAEQHHREFSKFKRIFRSEVEKIDAFFVGHMRTLRAKLAALQKEIEEYGVVPSNEINENLSKTIRKQKKNRELSVVRALGAIYLEVAELSSFATLNIILCIKILKKHDKHELGRDAGSEPLYPAVLCDLIYPTSFGSTGRLLLPADEGGAGGGAGAGGHVSVSVPVSSTHACMHAHTYTPTPTSGHGHDRAAFVTLKNSVVSLYATFCCDGDLIEAHGKLLIGKDEESADKSSNVKFLFGVVTVACLWFLWECTAEPGEGMTLWNDPAIYLYSFLGNLVMYEWLWGVNVYVWEKSFINYLVLLDLTLQHSPSPSRIFTKAAGMTLIFLSNIILYYKARRGAIGIGVDANVFPVAIALLAACYAAAQVRRRSSSASSDSSSSSSSDSSDSSSSSSGASSNSSSSSSDSDSSASSNIIIIIISSSSSSASSASTISTVATPSTIHPTTTTTSTILLAY
jgi:hypothetical protein